MLPSDILGTSIYDLNNKTFTLKKGPIFTSLLLAERNQSHSSQDAVGSSGSDGRKTSHIGWAYSKTKRPIHGCGTQNPVEFEGTYPLPEAQLDRFMLKVMIGYPDAEAERQMLLNWQDGFYRKKSPPLEPCVTVEEILSARSQLDKIKVEESILTYLMEIVQKSRSLSDLQLGASPRAALSWLAAAKSHAAIEGKDFVTPDNVKFVAEPVLRHRLILTAEAELDGVTVSQGYYKPASAGCRSPLAALL